MAPRWTWVFLAVHIASRVLIATGETCSYSEEVGKKGPQNLWSGFQSTANLNACQSFCGRTSGCVAGEFNSLSFACYLYNVVPTLSDDPKTTFFQRTCVPDTTTAATTVTATTSDAATRATLTSTATTTAATIVTSTTPTPTTRTTSSLSDATTTTLAPTTTPTTIPTTAPPSCKMTRSSGTTGVSGYYKFSLRNVDSCNSICLYIRTCRATTYRLGICTLHPGTSTAASGDIVDFVRQTCNNGTFCCMSSITTQRASGSPLLSINTTASLGGCEAICLAVAECQRTYYSDESCFFYTTTSTTFGGTIVFSRKTCPVQTNPGNLAFDGTCKVTTTTITCTSCGDTNNSAYTRIIHGNIIDTTTTTVATTTSTSTSTTQPTTTPTTTSTTTESTTSTSTTTLPTTTTSTTMTTTTPTTTPTTTTTTTTTPSTTTPPSTTTTATTTTTMASTSTTTTGTTTTTTSSTYTTTTTTTTPSPTTASTSISTTKSSSTTSTTNSSTTTIPTTTTIRTTTTPTAETTSSSTTTSTQDISSTPSSTTTSTESSTTAMSSTVSDPDSLQIASIGVIAAAVTSGTFIIAFFLTLICILIFGARRRKRTPPREDTERSSSGWNYNSKQAPAVITTDYIIYRGPNSISVSKENISIKQHPSPHDDHRHHRLKPSPRLNYLDYQAYVGQGSPPRTRPGSPSRRVRDASFNTKF